MKAPSPYKKLPGFGRGLASYTRLYLGPDHLLQVSSTMFNERYKRFYFRDIQAFIILRSPTWIWFMFAFGGCGALMLFIALLSETSVSMWIFSSLAGLFLAIAAAHGLGGPSCRCYIRTAVQTERVTSLGRARRAERVLASVKASIDSAQSSMASTPEPTPAPTNPEPSPTTPAAPPQDFTAPPP
jgi:hypothetical protein